ncbi:MAG: T9SS type A sorting domain-containing protein [Candidatus Eisenbacteria bacterium]|nr:T9SS type A sorting domain-containing protein [Candidatus Eisenbacteria bacterium]
MRLRALLVILILVLGSAPALADNFTFECRSDNFRYKPLGVDSLKFIAYLNAVPPGSDQVRVIFEPHLPDWWFAQWCQHSTGICYVGNQTITLSTGQWDWIEIDIFPQDDPNPGIGWVDVTIESIVDPMEKARCTYTLFYGTPLPSPPPNLVVNCGPGYMGMQGEGEADFYMPIRNATAVDDSVIVRVFPAMPDDWFAQYCLQSSGICYFDGQTLPLPAGLQDSIHVQVFVGPTQATGAYDFALQSSRNPSIVDYCYYRVNYGPTGSGPDASASGPAVRVVPNPSGGSTAFLLRSAGAAEGRLAIFSADGRVIHEYPAVDLRSGSAQLRWDGRDGALQPVPSGVYFYRFTAGGQVTRGTMIRTR